MAERADHQAGVLAGELVGRLTYIHWLKLVLLPEGEELFGHTEGCANVVDGYRPPLTKFLQDGLHVLLRLQFLLLETCCCCSCCLKRCAHFSWLELLSLICDVLGIGIRELTLIVLDKEVKSA